MWAFAVLLWAAGAPIRPVRYADVPEKLAGDPARFASLVRSLERRTAERLAEGEWDHLVFFALQARTFTPRPRIEPALSAREFIENGGAAVPPAAAARLRDLLAAVRKPGGDERLAYFRGLVEAHGFDDFCAAYRRAMTFLYKKEFGGGASYTERSHSSDTQLEANFAVRSALEVAKALEPGARLERVLIVGPGLDFAPRTEFFDFLPPQSYQPFAVADALLGLGLAAESRLSISCVDINPRVVEFLRRPPARLTLLSRLEDPEFAAYFREFGRHIGSETAVPALPGRLRKAIVVRRGITGTIGADRLNILIERYEAQFDLAVATNVLPYFSNQELLLALSNIAGMLRPGGWLVHNELRPEMEIYGRELGLAPVQARTLRLSSGARPLFDDFVLQRKVH